MVGFIQSQKLSTRVAMNRIKKRRTKGTCEEVHAKMKVVSALKQGGRKLEKGGELSKRLAECEGEGFWFFWKKEKRSQKEEAFFFRESHKET